MEKNSFEVWRIFDGDTFVHQNFRIDKDGRILGFEEYGFEGYSQEYKYVGKLKNPYPKPPYPRGLPHNKFFSLDATSSKWKVLYNGDVPQMLVDATGANPSDTLFFFYGSPD